MSGNLKRLSALGRMLLPLGVYEWKRRRDARAGFAPQLLSLLKRNVELKGRHAGERCFILANGPSVKSLDLELLKGETVFSVSNGYLHKGYNVFAPRYHLLPQITYGTMAEDDAVRWFSEMDRSLGNAEIFLSTTEMPLVQSHNLFEGKVVRYIHFWEDFDSISSSDIIDISQPVPRVQSVPIMALMVAIYMGFRKIILLGVDHSDLTVKRYEYAFDLKAQHGKDVSVNPDGTLKNTMHDNLQSFARLWRQYRKISVIAREHGVEIINSTPGGELDEFERVEFKKWFD